jgi:hypothetical protein
MTDNQAPDPEPVDPAEDLMRGVVGLFVMVLAFCLAPLLGVVVYSLLKGPYAAFVVLMGYPAEIASGLAKMAAGAMTFFAMLVAIACGVTMMPQEQSEDVGEVE